MKQIGLHPLALSLALAFPAFAQTVETAAPELKKDSTKLEQVIVTGSRRVENLKDVPMSISAMKSEALDTYNASGQDIRALSSRVPSLNIESDYGRSFPRFYIRGLGNTDFDLNASQPVGLVVDDVVQESPMLKGFPVFDVEQVEVLRGPQGTLFGRNSPAGVLKFDSVKPGKRLDGYASLGFGRNSAINFEGAINVPLNADWALRASAISQQADDRVFNPRATGERALEGFRDRAARVQASYKNGDFYALFNVHGRDMTGSATTFRANIIKKGTNELVDGFNYASYPSDGLNSQTLTSAGASMRLRWDLNGVTLNSITAYDRAKFYSRADVDGGYGAAFLPNALLANGTPNPAVMGPSYPGQAASIPFPAETADGLPYLKQVTQELRASSNTTAPLQWIAGLYAFSEDIQVDSFNFDSFAPGNPQNGYAVQHQHSRSWAAFGNLSYALSDKLKLRGGLRYTSDKKDFDAQRDSHPFLPTIARVSTHPKSTNVSWDLGANYALDRSTALFSRIATGYRAPSVQGRVLFFDASSGLSPISEAKAEKVLSIEAGFKKDILDNAARISGTAFTYQVKDMQLTAGSGSVNQNRLVNAAKAVGSGFEVDVQAILNNHWKTTLGVSYNDTEIKDRALFVSPCGAPCTVTDPAGSVKGTVLIGGNPLPRAPKWVGNFTLKYSREIGQGELTVLTDWSYKDQYNMFLYEAKEYRAKAMLEGGLRAGYSWNNGKYEVAAYVRNMTNRQQLIAAIDFNNLTGIVNEPRSYGIQFKASY